MDGSGQIGSIALAFAFNQFISFFCIGWLVFFFLNPNLEPFMIELFIFYK